MDKILKWCGWLWDGMSGNWMYDDGESTFIPWCKPVLDMNFFIKYVVPKLEFSNIQIGGEHVWIELAYQARSVNVHNEGIDPNEAWQEALIKLIER